MKHIPQQRMTLLHYFLMVMGLTLLGLIIWLVLRPGPIAFSINPVAFAVLMVVCAGCLSIGITPVIRRRWQRYLRDQFKD